MAVPHESDRLDVARRGKVLVVRLPRRLGEGQDVNSAWQRLLALLRRGGPPRLVLSLAVGEESGSALVGRLIMLHRQAEAAGGRLALCRLPPALRGALEQTRLMAFFHVYDTEDDAAAALELVPLTLAGAVRRMEGA
jgi:anti-anti-sigma regulatory factor